MTFVGAIVELNRSSVVLYVFITNTSNNTKVFQDFSGSMDHLSIRYWKNML